jgi:hypothetical protein
LITIVSGLPRSGTSLVMQMLAAGGVPILSDHERQPDTDNPRGYLEWERIKQLPKDPTVIDEAEGKVVKVISQLLLSLPPAHDYRVIFVQRPLAEVLKSQDEMLRRRGTHDPGVDQGVMKQAFQSHLYQVNTWLTSHANVRVLRLPYHSVLEDAKLAAESVAEFLGGDLDISAMTAQVDLSLYRQRVPG